MKDQMTWGGGFVAYGIYRQYNIKNFSQVHDKNK
jgi:hypothetical protein